MFQNPKVIAAKESFKPVIEKGIPIPPRAKRGEAARSSIFYSMEINDSVWLPSKTAGNASYAAKIMNYKFATRKENGGIRIWRIA